MAEQQEYVVFRFYEELNDHLPARHCKVSFEQSFCPGVTIKDLIESVGVPHTEVDLILVNGMSVGFDYQVRHNDRISVYPVFECMDISTISKVRPQPLRTIKFVLDVNLGKLARYLRMAGFDTYYEKNCEDEVLARISSSEHRILLTRDRQLLKRRIIDYGHFVRQTRPLLQLDEIIRWFDLSRLLQPFSRCLQCNGLLSSVDKKTIANALLPETRKVFHHFKQCQNCHKIYWQGSHYERMKTMLARYSPDDSHTGV